MARLTSAETAARMNMVAMTILFLDELAYTLPQNIPPITAAPVPKAVTTPTWVPEKPMELRYCPIKGHTAPSGK